MKKYFKLFGVLLAGALAITGCEKDENRISYEGGTVPVLAASTTAVKLAAGSEDLEAIKLNWTNPEYKFTTGISSQDVNYTIEMDTLGANFASKIKYTTTVSKDLVKSFTVAELNGILGNTMLLTFGKQYTIEVRVISSLATNAVPLTSNKISFTATAFIPPPKVEPPASGNLFITGGATPLSWQCGCATDGNGATQKFTKLSNTLFELTIALKANDSYLLLPVYGSWAAKYGINIKNDPGTVNGGDFKPNGEDILSPAVAGNYKITVNFQTGKFTVVKI